jgi:hypothetical protein
LRVFITCFDASQIFVYDPNAGAVENVINVGLGPFAMAFDPFSIDDVAQGKVAELDPRQSNPPLGRYRFAYVASFTNSYVQVIDLDDSLPSAAPYPHASMPGAADGGAVPNMMGGAACPSSGASLCAAGDSLCDSQCCPTGWGCMPDPVTQTLKCVPVSDITFERPVFTLGLPTKPKGA